MMDGHARPHAHPQVSPEILRELVHGVARDARSGSGPSATAELAASGAAPGSLQAALAGGRLLFGGRPAAATAAAGAGIGQHVAEDVRHLAPVPMMAEDY